MKKIKRLMSSLLAAALLLTAAPTAFAAMNDTGFSDVAADAWYADAVDYIRDNGLMSGTSATTFSPNTEASRSMLAAILYRAAGGPAVSGSAAFSDVAADAYYADAVAWAAETGIVSGYGNGLFGSNDSVSREQIATILWRYAGSPSAGAGQDFADESTIAVYAADAVDWARANGIVNGKEGNRFDPQGSATRAQVATILRNYMTLAQGGEQTPETGNGNVLVVYFSATGSTEKVVHTIADTLDADLFELVPTDPYTADDLDWTTDGSRVNAEHDDPAQRMVELTASTVDNWDEYDTVFIGYPIWWGIAAWPVDSFIAANDFTGKTIVPFSTHGGSSFAGTPGTIRELEPGAEIVDGLTISRNSIQDAEQEIIGWLDGLDL
ncbi:hypothetical protein CE91St43_24680 [Oscillospiraceae bacterium]|nr:hypothetical protein CE91St43_24680 [Oscillospiraceae bacterium]